MELHRDVALKPAQEQWIRHYALIRRIRDELEILLNTPIQMEKAQTSSSLYPTSTCTDASWEIRISDHKSHKHRKCEIIVGTPQNPKNWEDIERRLRKVAKEILC